MGVSSSLYSSISGLNTMGEAMSILGDNVANVNTISFKSSRSTFQDVLAQSVSTASGSAQVGRGVTMSTVSSLFAQGSFESSSSALDMAIGGQGFFMMRSPDSAEADMYTRAGQFDFDREGYIVGPSGNYAQGWTIDSLTGETAGTIGDMLIPQTTPPVETQEVQLIANLDSRKDNEVNQIRLFDSWNGTNPAATNPTEPIDSTQFDYTTAIKIFDTEGASHDLTVYFDRTTNDNEWEFLVTSDPAEDKRVLDAREQKIYVPDTTFDYENHKGAGALMYGTLQFDTSGNIQGMEAFKVPPDGKVDPSLDDNRLQLLSTDSYFSFEANFTGATVNDSIKLNLGAKYSGVTSNEKQTLVSELGALDASGTGGDFITAETLWKNVVDENGRSLSGDGASTTSDTITIRGFNNKGVRQTLVYDVGDDLKVQDFLDKLDTTFSVNSSIDASGRLKITDSIGGPSGLSIDSIIVDGTVVQPSGGTNDDANPFGETGINGDTVLNITTSKKKLVAQGQLLTANGTPSTSPTVTWENVQSEAGTAVATNDTFQFKGFKGDGTAVDITYTVADQTADTVQDLLDFVESAFDADAEIDGAGRLVVTDRVADSSITTGYHSSLVISEVIVKTPGTSANPFDDLGRLPAAEGVGGFAGDNAKITTVSTFHAIEASASGEDGSLQGASVSSSFTSEALSTTQYANSSSTIFQDQNGFASGFMQSVSVDTLGVVTGNYSNGQVLKKAQIALAGFSNMSGLFKEGGNIFKETTDSGAPVTGTAGTNGLGSISPNSLEQSNVDLGAEFVKLITVQRGFQANSKIITTTDEMMNDLINMKR